MCFPRRTDDATGIKKSSFLARDTRERRKRERIEYALPFGGPSLSLYGAETRGKNVGGRRLLVRLRGEFLVARDIELSVTHIRWRSEGERCQAAALQFA